MSATDARRRRGTLAVALAIAAVAAAWFALARHRRTATALSDDFASGRLDPARWVTTMEGDFSEHLVDVVAPDEQRGPRLRIRAATLGSVDSTVKVLGVRSARPVVPGPRAAVVRAEVDWNGQTNGSYLSADVVLSPHRTTGSALATPDWIRVGYVGVPPGSNARLLVSMSSGGRVRTLFAEGWPDERREGRPIGRQRLELRLDGRMLEVVENAKTLYRADVDLPRGDGAYLYLQASTHSNFPAREVMFDDVSASAM